VTVYSTTRIIFDQMMDTKKNKLTHPLRLVFK
jgi:hypothetical protein